MDEYHPGDILKIISSGSVDVAAMEKSNTEPPRVSATKKKVHRKALRSGKDATAFLKCAAKLKSQMEEEYQGKDVASRKRKLSQGDGSGIVDSSTFQMEDSDDNTVVELSKIIEPLRKKVKLTKVAKKQMKIKDRISKSLPAKHELSEEKTIFIGNVPVQTKRKRLIQYFSKYGKVESCRIRGVAAENLDMSKKEAIARKKLHPLRSSVIAYLRFQERECAEKALEANREVFEGLHLRVDLAANKVKSTQNSVFVGNLPWEAEDESFYQHFCNCGEIESVRIVRSNRVGASKGFGYVNFKSKEAVDMALKLDGETYLGRPLRISQAVKKPKPPVQQSRPSQKGLKSKGPWKGVFSNPPTRGKLPPMKLKFLKNKKQPKEKSIMKRNYPTEVSKNFSGISAADKIHTKKPKLSKAERRRRYIAHVLTDIKT